MARNRAEEIAKRIERGFAEGSRYRFVRDGGTVYCASTSGETYAIAIHGGNLTCSCPDFSRNGEWLGTCKHQEALKQVLLSAPQQVDDVNARNYTVIAVNDEAESVQEVCDPVTAGEAWQIAQRMQARGGVRFEVCRLQ